MHPKKNTYFFSILLGIFLTPPGSAAPFEKPSKEVLKKGLTPLQYKITQEEGTEPAFDNEFWDHHADGIYVDIVSGEPLFSSMDKYDSKTGWPSFAKPLEPSSIVEREDRLLFTSRTEVRSALGDSHLGHVFTDGPKPTGLRYCVNSAALKFVPADQLKGTRYDAYSKAFELAKKETPPTKTELSQAILAGGCFWCMEPPFEDLEGVTEVVSGYTGGTTKNPSYKDVSLGKTGHTEAVRITFDPAKTSYETILTVFWKNIDPEAINAQFCDSGSQYRSGIYYGTEEQKTAALASKKKVSESGKLKKEIATEIKAATDFWPAEDYHQDYYSKNPIRYKYYRSRCGRDARLKELWGPN